MSRFTWSGMTRAVFAVCVGMLLLSVTAQAQQWQSMAGGKDIEGGEGGASPLAAGNGYITVGSTNSFRPDFDVYVAEWNVGGGLVWAFAYDFGLKADEFGFDIQECQNGDFIITGRTDDNGGDLILLRINANGGIIWGKTFGGVDFEAGYDVLETANKEIVAVGEAHPNDAADQDGLVVRTNANGGVIFVSTYQPANGDDDVLYGVDEALNTNLIVCGSTSNDDDGLQAWLMRLTANGAFIWSRDDGGRDDEVLFSVIELRMGNQKTNIVAVGVTTAPAPGDIYVDKYDMNGNPLADLSIGTAAAFEEAKQIREAKSIPNPGDLILAGNINPGPIADEDGYAVAISPVWVNNGPVLTRWSMAYGGNGIDYLQSAVEDPTQAIRGFILCGTTASPDLLPMNDPQQMYTIRTDLFGISTCNEARVCDRVLVPNYPVYEDTVERESWDWGIKRSITKIDGKIWQPLCFTPWLVPPGPIAPPDGGGDHAPVPNDQSTSGQISEAAPQDAHARTPGAIVVDNIATATVEPTAAVRTRRR